MFSLFKNMVIMRGDRGNLLQWSFCYIHMHIKSLCCIPYTDAMSRVNYLSIKLGGKSEKVDWGVGKVIIQWLDVLYFSKAFIEAFLPGMMLLQLHSNKTFEITFWHSKHKNLHWAEGFIESNSLRRLSAQMLTAVANNMERIFPKLEWAMSPLRKG